VDAVNRIPVVFNDGLKLHIKFETSDYALFPDIIAFMQRCGNNAYNLDNLNIGDTLKLNYTLDVPRINHIVRNLDFIK
jgi:hypothetical protein